MKKGIKISEKNWKKKKEERRKKLKEGEKNRK